MYRPRYLWEGKGCTLSMISMRVQGILYVIPWSKLALSVHHLASCRLGAPGKV